MLWVKRILFFYLWAILLLVAAALISLAIDPGPQRDRETYYEAYWSTITGFDPAQVYDAPSGDLINMCVEGLYEYGGINSPEDLQIIPALAAAMPEVSDDGLVYTIRLRPNIRYPDIEPWKGTPRHVRAEDIEFAFRRMANFHVASTHFDHLMRGRVVGADEFFDYTQSVLAGEVDWDYPLPGVESLDDLTLRITLTERFPQFIYKIMMPVVSPMPREYYMFVTANDTKPENIRWRMLPTGPYILDEYQREYRAVFRENPFYRGRPDVDGHPSGQGGRHPSITDDEAIPRGAKRVVFRYSRDQLPRWYNFTLGLFDKSRVPRDAFGAAITITGGLSPELAEKGVIMALQPKPTARWVGFAMDVEWIRENIALRRAMCLAIDRERHLRVFYNGDGYPAYGLLPPAMAGYSADHRAPYFRYDPDEARRLAEEAKQFHRKKYGEELPPIRYTVGSAIAQQRQAAEDFKLAWEKIGLKCELEFVGYGKFIEALRDRQYDCWKLGWIGDYPDDETFLNLFYSKNRSPGPNSSCYANAEFDAIYEQARIMDDTPERRDLYARMIEIIERDVPVILISFDVQRELGYDWLGDLPDHVWLKARWAYYELDGDLREKRLSGELTGTRESLIEQGRWPGQTGGASP